MNPTTRFLKTALFAGVPFGVVMGLFFLLAQRNALGLVLGALAGLGFGMALAGFVEWQRSQFTKNVPLLDGEQLLHNGPANHLVGAESVGGWLYLTDRRLLFRSHAYNVQNHELTIPLVEIRDVAPCATLGVVPNGLKVATAHGDERFVVQGRGEWVAEINRRRGH